MTVEGDLIPLPDEKATEAQQRATAAEQRAEQLAARLRELGVDPDQAKTFTLQGFNRMRQRLAFRTH